MYVWNGKPVLQWRFLRTPDGGPFFQIRNYFMFHLLYRLSTSVTLESEHTGALLVTCRKNRNIFMCLLNILMQMPSCCLLFHSLRIQNVFCPSQCRNCSIFLAQILRKINFVGARSKKLPFLSILEALNFNFR